MAHTSQNTLHSFEDDPTRMDSILRLRLEMCNVNALLAYATVLLLNLQLSKEDGADSPNAHQMAAHQTSTF